MMPINNWGHDPPIWNPSPSPSETQKTPVGGQMTHQEGNLGLCFAIPQRNPRETPLVGRDPRWSVTTPMIDHSPWWVTTHAGSQPPP